MFSIFTFLSTLLGEVIAAQGIRIYSPPMEADDEDADHAHVVIGAIPFSIIGSSEDIRTPDNHVVKGREYIWCAVEGWSIF